jgi:hypothetical protein
MEGFANPNPNPNPNPTTEDSGKTTSSMIDDHININTLPVSIKLNSFTGIGPKITLTQPKVKGNYSSTA